MNWSSYLKGFAAFLKLEKSLSENSIEAYLHDIEKFHQFLDVHKIELQPKEVELNHLRKFLNWTNELGMSARTQARVISGIKAFFKYLLIENILDNDPTTLLEAPKLGKKLPEVMTVEEINAIIDAIDLSKKEGSRNKAMLETLYSSGLRVSELVNLKISHIYSEEGFLKITGKGNKERIVPIGKIALKHILIYLEQVRCHVSAQKEDVDILFLNNRGKKLTRVMVFTIIKQLSEKIGLKKSISPHTFRHSFATHLIDGGADLRAIQDMLGHESITTTEIYTHLDREYLRAAIMQFHPRSGKY
jgi:integrase/recombinase XerD